MYEVHNAKLVVMPLLPKKSKDGKILIPINIYVDRDNTIVKDGYLNERHPLELTNHFENGSRPVGLEPWLKVSKLHNKGYGDEISFTVKANNGDKIRIHAELYDKQFQDGHPLGYHIWKLIKVFEKYE